MNSCVDISFSRIWQPVDVRFTCIEEDKEAAEIAFSRVWTPIEISFTKVCSLGSEFYIHIPMEHIWLTPDNDFSEDVEVYANVEWVIE